MNEPKTPLDAWLAAARADTGRRRPPEWIEPAFAARLEERAALRNVRRATPVQQAAPVTGARWRWWPVLPVGLAAALVLAVAVLAYAPHAERAAPARPAFVALTRLEAIAAEPQPVVVATEVPRAQLAALGLPVDPARADQPVRAEFLVSRRGAVLAVRLPPE